MIAKLYTDDGDLLWVGRVVETEPAPLRMPMPIRVTIVAEDALLSLRRRPVQPAAEDAGKPVEGERSSVR